MYKKKLLKEAYSSKNVAYILNDNELFFLTGYKVLKNQKNNGLIPCVKSVYNGKIKLLYFTDKYQSLSVLINTIDVKTFRIILMNLIGNIIEVKGNGFLNCKCLDISFEKIFIDTNTYEVYLIYLPIKNLEKPMDELTFESDLRTNLIQGFNTSVSLSKSEDLKLLAELANGRKDLKALYQYLLEDNNDTDRNPLLNNAASVEKRLKLIAERYSFEIPQKEYIIGRSPNMVDGLIEGNPKISRRHCSILYEENQYYMIDLGSANGTYLDGIRLKESNKEILRNGQKMKLADIEFNVIYN